MGHRMNSLGLAKHDDNNNCEQLRIKGSDQIKIHEKKIVISHFLGEFKELFTNYDHAYYQPLCKGQDTRCDITQK